MRISDWSSDVCSSDLACEELLPGYLRFLRGVVDSEDLPLNISREMLQHNPVLAKIRAGLTKRVLAELKKKAEGDADSYAGFWDNFGAVLQEGLYEDAGQRAIMLGLARFRRTAGDKPPSLAEFVGRMKEGQRAEERRVGTALGRTCRLGWAAHH